ncbi:MAG TPA: hypothetical protein VJ741_16835 [Solirubrobacteraceae bacterium]|nr:hypothetical protein [Solirubrobacteraceae bacterium]
MVYPHIQYQGPAYPDHLRDATPARPRELDSRVSDGIHVSLLWHPADGQVSVAVQDSKTGEAFELPVGKGERLRDVFLHPYAYAAGRRTAVTQSGPAADVAIGVRAAV